MCRSLVVPLVGVSLLVLFTSPAAAEDKPIAKPGPVAAEDQPTAKPEFAVKRLGGTGEEALRAQLQNVPESGFDKLELDGMYAYLTNEVRQVAKPATDFGPRAFEMLANQNKLPEMAALPWIGNRANELTKEKAGELSTLSQKLHFTLDRSVRRGSKADLAGLRKFLTGKEWASPQAVPTLTQILQVENADVRLVLVESLAAIKGEEASVALARRAVFDLSPKVREKAVEALVDRPAAEYTSVLLAGFRYPWSAAADHAAEAVAALKRADLVPELVNLLKEPDPALPVKTGSGYSVKEVVRLNHFCNCVLCHAPSVAKSDRVRAPIVLPSEKPPEVAYYSKSSGTFVRADLTHLRQDFSVVQPVQNPGKWPDRQRFDYLVRTRTLTEAEQVAFEQLQKDGMIPRSYPQQASAAFALRELTGKDLGTTYEQWSAVLAKPIPQK